MAARTVLVVAGHPDNEILGCGATAARLVQKGHDVYFATLGEGITSRHGTRDAADASQLSRLQQHARTVSHKVGVKELFLHQLPDTRLERVPFLEVVKLVEDLVEKLRPDIVYTHHVGDLNIDHGVIHRFVHTAARSVAGQPVREIYAFEVRSSTEWAFQRPEPVFRPNVFVDVSRTLEIKIAAMACYETGEFPHPRSPLRATAARRGTAPPGSFRTDSFCSSAARLNTPWIESSSSNRI